MRKNVKRDCAYFKKYNNPAIVFLFPDEQGNFLYHLGVGYILSYLRKKGIFAESFVSTAYLGLKDILTLINNKRPNFIGFTCFNTNYFLVKIIAEHIKRDNPGIKIIVGGPSATFYDREIMHDSKAIDICVRGEGEDTVYKLISSRGGFLRNISGITYRAGKRIIRNPGSQCINNLDTILSPYLSGITDPIDLWKINQEVPILTSRGCIYRCTYCNFSAMSRYTIRYHSVERVMDELRFIYRVLSKNGLLDIKVMIQDDIFTLDRNRVKEICSSIKEEGINLKFWLLTRADTVNKELLELLFSVGFRDINFGLESAAPKILYNIKKIGLTDSNNKDYGKEKLFIHRTRENVKLAKEIGFKVGVSIILGLPGETLKEGIQTLDFVKKLNLDTYAHNYLTIFKGTELFDTYLKYGLKLPKPRFKGVFNDCLTSPPTYTYDILRLPILKNEIQIGARVSYAIARTIDFLSGYYDKDNSRYAQDTLVLDKEFPRESGALNHAFKTRFIYGYNLDNLLGDKVLTKVMLIMGTVSSFSLQYKLSIEELIQLAPEYLKFEFTVNKFSDIDFLLFQDRRIAKITDAEDIRDFLNRNPIRNYILLDTCRWSHYCPATHLKRLIIKANNILPCFQGHCIGSIKDSLYKTRRCLLSLKEKEEKSRRCIFCSEKDNCSKCLFLGSMEPSTYCQIRRTHPQISTRLTSLRVITKMINHARNQI